MVLTDLSMLAGYDLLAAALMNWIDITSPPAHAVWALIPQPEESGGRPGARVDTTALTRMSPEQFVQVDRNGLSALLAAAESSTESDHTASERNEKEHV